MEDQGVKAELAVAIATNLRADLAASNRVNQMLHDRWHASKNSHERRALSIAAKQVFWVIVELEQALGRLEKKESP